MWLETHEEDARNRSDKGDHWWELRACDYYDLFDQELVTYPEMSQGPKFALKERGIVSNNKTFLIPESNAAMLAILNSRASWFLLRGICTALRGGKWRLELRSDFVRDMPLPRVSKKQDQALDRFGKHCHQLVQQIETLKGSVRNRLFDLLPGAAERRLTGGLSSWWLLTFPEFLKDLKKAFRVEIPLRERGEWESYLNESKAELRDLTAQLATAERDIDAQVYSMFNLDSEEVTLLEDSLAGQY